MASRREEHIIGLDIGSETTTASVVKVGTDGSIELTGMAQRESYGIKHGVVVNIGEAVQNLELVIEEAEQAAGINLDFLYVGISGNHVKGLNARGVASVSGKEGIVDRWDIKRANDSARTIPIPAEDEIVHMLVQGYTIDGEDGIQQPLGLFGRRLEVDVHVITGYEGTIRNLVKSIQRTRAGLRGIIFNPLAAAEMVLNESEKELGVVLIDMGAGTTDLLVYIKGKVWHSASINMGGEQVTSDIANGVRITSGEAEELKRTYGIFPKCQDKAGKQEISISGLRLGERRLLRREILSDIISARIEEIMEQCHEELIESGVDDYIASGIVLTGGSSMLPNISGFVEELLGMPVRIGEPGYIRGLTDEYSNPSYTVALGLPLFGLSYYHRESMQRMSGSSLMRVAGSFAGWLAHIF